MLAGVSTTYYTRLEQGLSTNASEAVIDAIARAWTSAKTNACISSTWLVRERRNAARGKAGQSAAGDTAVDPVHARHSGGGAGGAQK